MLELFLKAISLFLAKSLFCFLFRLELILIINYKDYSVL